MNLIHKINIVLVFLAATFNAAAGEYYWVASSGGNWEDSENWSESPEGEGGAGVPGEEDWAYFESPEAGNCTIKSAINVYGIAMQEGYSRSLVQQSTIEVGVGGWSMQEATFIGGSSAIVIEGDLSVESGASFTSTSGELKAYKDVDLIGYFDSNSGTFNLYSDASTNYIDNITASNQVFNHFKVVNDYSTSEIGSTEVSGDFSVMGDLVFDGTGATTIEGGTIYAKGNIYHNATSSAYQGGDATIEVSGTSTQFIYGSSAMTTGAYVKLLINKSSGTLYLSDVINAGGGWEYQSGILDASTYSSKVNFRSLGLAYYITGDCSLNDVNLDGDETSNDFYWETSTLTVLGDMSMTGSEAIKFKSGTIVIEGHLKLENTSSAGTGSATIIFAGSGDQQIISAVAKNQSRLPNILILKDGGVLTASGIISMKGDLVQRRGTFIPGNNSHWYFKGTSAGQKIDLLDSDYGFADVHISPQSTTVYLNKDIKVDGTLQISSDKILDLQGNNLILEGDFVVKGDLVHENGKVIFSGSELQSIDGDGIAVSFNDVEVKSNSEVKLLDDVIVSGVATFSSGEFDLNGHTLEVRNSDEDAIRSGLGSIKKASSGQIKISSESANTYTIPYQGVASATWGYDFQELRFQTDLAESQEYQIYVTTDYDLYISVNTEELVNSQTIRMDMITNSGIDLPILVSVDASGRFTSVVYADPLDGGDYAVDFTDFGDGWVRIDNIDDFFDEIIVRSPFASRNWVSQTHYDTDGNVISSSKVFIDGLGRKDQRQVENLETGDVLASQVVFDALGRPALYTLPAVSGSVLSFNSTFLKDASSGTYDYNDFDLSTTRNNPSAAGTSSNTVGHYYSSSGEEHIGETSYPFSRVRYSADPSSQRIAQAQSTESFIPGSGHESWAFSMPIYDELDLILGNNNSYKVQVNASNKLQSTAISITGGVSGVKKISRLPSGEESVSYVGPDGSLIATCRSGLGSSCVTQSASNLLRIDGTRSVDIHLPYANIASLNLPDLTYGTGATNATTSEYNYVLYDLLNDNILTEGSSADYTISGTGDVTFVGPSSSDAKFLRIYLEIDADYEGTILSGGDEFNDVAITYELDYSHWTLNYYDLAGLPRKSVSAKDCSCNSSGTHAYYSSYDYNSYGQVVTESLPDEGENNYLYDERGRLRFSQGASQAEDEVFSFISYDDYGRVIKEGEYITENDRYYFQDHYQVGTSSYSGGASVHTILDDYDGINTAHTTELTELTYYTELEGITIPVSAGMQSQYEQDFTLGRLAKVSANGERTTWYSYDQFGRMAFEVQEVLDAGFGSLPNADDYFKATRFEYEPVLGRPEKVIYQDHESDERFQHVYSYNANGQMESVKAYKGSGTGTLVGEASYEYNTHFQLKRKELGGDLQGIDYVYRANGALKAVNHPNLTSAEDPGGDGGSGSSFFEDLFGYTIDFFKDDYSSNDNNIISSVTSTAAKYYKGLVAAVRYKINDTYATDADVINKNGTTTTLISAGTDECRFTYNYDEHFRLANAQFDVYHHTSSSPASNSTTSYDDFKVFGSANSGTDIAYDDNGNITSLMRNGYDISGNALMDDLVYTYLSGSNKLGEIQDQSTSTVIASDFPETSTSELMTYDHSGRMVSSNAEDIQQMEYHHSGKIKKVLYLNSDYIEYFYDHTGSVCRSLSHDFSSSTTHTSWYINAGGSPKAIYEKETATSSLELIEFPFVGNGRVGTYDTDQEAVIYELKDHLGNVRVAFKEGTSTLEVVSWADYYPFGSIMPGRSYSTTAYRYGNAGEETAYSTGWTAFPLRMFNNQLGRFGAPDPFRQMHNAYQGMGNNPANFIDPSGGAFFGYTDWVNQQDAYVYNSLNAGWEQNYLFGAPGSDGGGGGGGVVNYDGLLVDASVAMYHMKMANEHGGQVELKDATSLMVTVRVWLGDDVAGVGYGKDVATAKDGMTPTSSKYAFKNGKLRIYDQDYYSEDGVHHTHFRTVDILNGSMANAGNQGPGTQLVQQPTPEAPSGGLITNNSTATIYYKPDELEDGSNWAAIPLAPGESTNVRIDALNVNGTVYKVDPYYDNIQVNANDELIVDYPWYLGWLKIEEKNTDWMYDKMWNHEAKEPAYYEYPEDSGHYVPNAEWWNIFHPTRQVIDPRFHPKWGYYE